MRPGLRRLGPLAAAVVLAIAVAAGCNGGGADGGGDGAAGAPVNRDDREEAPTSRLDIPNITNAQGQDLDVVREELEAQLRKNCGGELCVRLRVERGSNDLLSVCEFDTTDPPPQTRVRGGSTVVILTGTQPCETEPAIETSPAGVPSPEDSDATGPPQEIGG